MELQLLVEFTLAQANSSRSAAIFSLGAWYNIIPNVEGEHPCAPYGLCDPLDENATLLALAASPSFPPNGDNAWGVDRLKMMLKENVSSEGSFQRASIPVHELKSLRYAMCTVRGRTGLLNPVGYVSDLQRLASWVAANRQTLRKHIAWMHPLPQHFGLSGTYPFAAFH